MKANVGDRIRLTDMGPDPYPSPPIGSEGEVIGACPMGRGEMHYTVKWDCGSGLNLHCPPDRFIVLPKTKG